MGKIIELKKKCPCCGIKRLVFKGDTCPECLRYFHEQWKLPYYVTKVN